MGSMLPYIAYMDPHPIPQNPIFVTQPRRCPEQHGAQGALQPLRLEQPLGAIAEREKLRRGKHHVETPSENLKENLFWQPWHGF